MGQDKTTLGSIHISPTAISTIAYHATLQSYGVVGLAPKNLVEGLASTITREPSRGVNVHFDGDQLDIDIYVIVEFGTRIASVLKVNVAGSRTNWKMWACDRLNFCRQLTPNV